MSDSTITIHEDGRESLVIEPHVEYYVGRTDGWKWIDGSYCWWEKFAVWLNGWDGLGQFVCEVRWRWNGSQQTIRKDYVHWSAGELAKRIREGRAERTKAEATS